MKKITLIILFLLSSVPSFSQSIWFTQNSGTSIKNLNAVYFINAQTGFIAGDSALILKTTNAGANWVKLNQGVNFHFISLVFTDSLNGYAGGKSIVGLSGIVFKTSNGGNNWSNMGGTSASIDGISFPSSTIGYTAGSSVGLRSAILKTINSGNNWSSQMDENVAYLRAIFFTDVNTGYTIGSGDLFKTTNGGINWVSRGDNIPSTGTCIYFINSTTGFISTDNGRLAKTTNAGNNWTTSPVLGTETPFTSTFFTSANTGYIVGAGGTIVQTYNGGTNWITNSSPNGEQLNGITFTSPEVGYIVGNHGTILKTTTGGLTFIQTVNSNVPEKFNLYQNYPNPFNPSTKIKFDLRNSGFTSVKVFNLNGREIKNIFSSYLNAGSYELNFNAENLASGIYYYKIQASGFTQTKKMILMK